MAKARQRGEQIRQFILTKIEQHPNNVATLTAQEFGITRQAVNKHIQRLVEQKAIEMKGSTKNKSYHLHSFVELTKTYPITTKLEEDIVWESDIKPLVFELPSNVKDIWVYGFTEMLNNAINHSSGREVVIQVEKTVTSTQMTICDDGEGIFRKI
ncbi:MAG: hypothetical protein KME18_11725 [Phormidium tanganyikae FI6-MK23]|nr:hypothetical protein [Phormidium tanganyikae FI6-MK23]